jgi:hypothetical protein
MSYKNYLKQLYFDPKKPDSYGKALINYTAPYEKRESMFWDKSNPTTPTHADCIACATSNEDIEEPGQNFKI